MLSVVSKRTSLMRNNGSQSTQARAIVLYLDNIAIYSG